MPPKRIALTVADTDAILAVPPKDYTTDLLRDWFGHGRDREPRFDASASLPIGPRNAAPPTSSNSRGEGEWDVRFAPNWSSIRETTPGRIVANSLVFARSEKMRRAFPYIDKMWDKKVLGDLQQQIVDTFIEGRIDYDDVAWAIDRLQWLGYAPASFLNPSLTIDTIRPTKAVRARKAQLLKEKGEALKKGDLKVLESVEKELLDLAASELDGKDPGYEIYKSGARGSFGNNYKLTAVMRGAIRKSDDPADIRVSTASLEEGIPADETHIYADLMVQASYGRSVMTATGGYLAKQLVSAFQGIRLADDPESDCGTRRTYRCTVENPKDFRYRFVKEGSKLTEITMENEASFKGRTVDMRSPLYCGMEGAVCSRCAGTLYYRMGIKNIGMLSWRAGSVLLNAALKAFHDTTLKLQRIKLADFTKEIT